jgi:hypothetical protein
MEPHSSVISPCFNSASSIFPVRHTTSDPPWPQEMEEDVKYNLEAFSSCIWRAQIATSLTLGGRVHDVATGVDVTLHSF